MIALNASQLAALCSMRVGTVIVEGQGDTVAVRREPDDGRRWTINANGQAFRIAEKQAA